VPLLIINSCMSKQRSAGHRTVNIRPQALRAGSGFIALGILSEALAIDFALGPDRRGKSSITFLPLFACVTIFPTAAAVLTIVVVLAFTELKQNQRLLWRAIFNFSQGILAVGLASCTYTTIRDLRPHDAIVEIVAFAGLAVTFFAVNLLIVSGYYSLCQPRSLFAVVKDLIGPGAGNLLYDLLASPIALAAVVLYRQLYVGGLLLVLLPLLLVRHSYLSRYRLEQANRDLLRVLIKAIETRDPYTSGHSVRVSTLARAIAEDLGLRGRTVEQIETAALLHDIGKIDSVYASIIGKPRELTEEERRIIRTHATRGAELLRSLTSLPEEVIAGVRHHHERYDGSGYPDGLSGEAIPLAARIVMLCDAIDAMLSDRPYRRALSIEQARAELQRCAGTQFDPHIVEVILRCNTLERVARLEPSPSVATDLAPVALPV